MARHGEWREYDVTPYKSQSRKRYWRQHVNFSESDWQSARSDAKKRANRAARSSRVGSVVAVNFVAIICFLVILYNVFGSLSFSKYRSVVVFDGNDSYLSAPLYHYNSEGDLVYHYIDPTLSRSSFLNRFSSVVEKMGYVTDIAYRSIEFVTDTVSDLTSSSGYLVCYNGSEDNPNGSIFLLGIDGNWLQRSSNWFSYDVTHVYQRKYIIDSGFVFGKADNLFSTPISTSYVSSDFEPVKYKRSRYVAFGDTHYLYYLYDSSGHSCLFLARYFSDYYKALDYYNELCTRSPAII